MLQQRRVHVSLAQTGHFCSPHLALFTYGASTQETRIADNLENAVQKQSDCSLHSRLQMLISYFTQLALYFIRIESVFYNA